MTSLDKFSSERIVPMRVIICGVQRTGTLSMRFALYQLGFHDCYHMHNVKKDPETDGPVWTRAIKARFGGVGELDKVELDKVLGKSQAVCDIPAALFGPELCEMYPDAKVVILNRDPEPWYESVKESIHKERSLASKVQMLFLCAFNTAPRAWIRFIMSLTGNVFHYDHRSEKDKALKWFQSTYDDFRARIPEERRIEFSVKDGWGPLCKHLEVPVPMIKDSESGELVEAPFPHLNDRAAFLNEIVQTQAQWKAESLNNLYQLVGKTVVTTVVAYIGLLTWKTRLGGRF